MPFHTLTRESLATAINPGSMIVRPLTGRTIPTSLPPLSARLSKEPLVSKRSNSCTSKSVFSSSQEWWDANTKRSASRKVPKRFFPSITIFIGQPAIQHRSTTSDSTTADWACQASCNLGNKFPRRIGVPPRVLQRVAVDARPIDQPQRVRLHVPSRRRVVVPHPVLVQAGFALEPLAGEAQVAVWPRGRVHAAERQICRLPDLYAGIVRRKNRAADVVGPAAANRWLAESLAAKTAVGDPSDLRRAKMRHRGGLMGRAGEG